MQKLNHPASPRYHSIAIGLHWIIALALLFMFISGLYMVNADISKADQFKLFQIHKSAGVIVLIAVAVRLVTRALIKRPELPASINSKEKRYASLGHLGLYLAMVIMPLSGWLMVSASSFGLPTIVFDTFEWPHIPGVARNKEIEALARNIHWYIALGFLALIAVHIAAVIKHKHKDNINLLKRMWWSKQHEE
jgi:cytochrome b561